MQILKYAEAWQHTRIQAWASCAAHCYSTAKMLGSVQFGSVKIEAARLVFARRAPRRLIRFVRKAAGIAHDFYFITVAAAVVMSAASSTAHFAGGPGRGPRVDVYMVFLMYGGPFGCRATARRPEGPPYLRTRIEIDPRTPARPQLTGPLSEGGRLKDQQAVGARPGSRG